MTQACAKVSMMKSKFSYKNDGKTFGIDQHVIHATDV